MGFNLVFARLQVQLVRGIYNFRFVKNKACKIAAIHFYLQTLNYKKPMRLQLGGIAQLVRALA